MNRQKLQQQTFGLNLNTKRYVFIIILLTLVMAALACGSFSSPTVAPEPTATTEQTTTPESTATFTPPPTLTSTPLPTSTSTPLSTLTPIPTFTPTPLPQFSEFLHAFYADVYPLGESLAVADSMGNDSFSSLPLAGQWEVILVPRDPRLYYLQANLFPNTTWGTPGADAKLYLDYWYKRGENLYFSGDTYHPVSQAMELLILVVVEVDQQYYEVGFLVREAGEGLSNNAEIVDEVVKEVLSLSTGGDVPIVLTPSEAQDIQSAFQKILGYAVGIDTDPTLPLPLRLALLESSLDSDKWAEPYQSAQTLASFGTAAGDALPELFTALTIKNDQQTTETKDALFQAIYAIQPDSLAIPVSGNPPEFEAAVACGIFSGYEPFMSDAETNMPLIIEALKDEKWERRALSAILLGEWVACNYDSISANIQNGWTTLSAALNDENPIVRMAVTMGLRGFSDSMTETLPILIEASTDADPRVRLAAVNALVYSFRYNQLDIEQQKVVLTALVNTMSDSDLDVRLASVSSISSVDIELQSIVVPALIKALTDENSDIRLAASSSLFFVTGQMGIRGATPEEEAAAWQKWWDENAP